MKILAQIPQEDCHVTLFSWNGKFIVKIEQGMLEQTYKLREMDVTSESDARKIVENEAFMQSVRERFSQMDEALYLVLQEL
jgi:hypothetical protein